MPNLMPNYPIYIPSKGRADVCYTARIFARDEVPFYLVVEEQEHDAYASRFGEERLLVLPFKNQGLIAARNWIKAHATASGAVRHWQFDDNIREFRRLYKRRRLPVRSGVACRIVEDFTDRYTNVAISGFNYEMFVVEQTTPFTKNCHVYSASLILNEIPYRWRTRYNDDTDICLQVLSGGWCTILVSVVMVQKIATMHVKGGNTDDLYQGDGRLKMARSLERQWPGVVTTKRRFDRPQHVIKSAWRKFDTPLIRRTDIEWPTGVDEYGMTLESVTEIRHPALRRVVESYRTNPEVPLDI